ncbi:Nucleotide-binding alpha-beta plait [Penicillium cf. griseofulvum]|uniref:Nucleolar protein 12 n=1 Tax=Penicillium cf. griseofulvum TaxID=2972120 RepID=A0A9W9MEH6_9EURO|nr:Nucleotide-binding alpha-beta plait [Penicillium cf. griseofulvum]KAJ5423813.1 Nucleotide-binding alpha-beta plait [Penicillium cf. griseofulvum]KAJ5430934.1 Nucleotide-binding alpha-beta plait [Penicillium cf. griseofulvum]
MGKKSKSSSKTEEKTSKPAVALPFAGASLDPTLSSLFAQSAGPVQAPVVKYVEPIQRAKKDEDDAEEEDLSSASDDEVMEDAEESDAEAAEEKEQPTDTQNRKRKRGGAGEEVEETYMRRIAKEEEKDEEKRKSEYAKRQKQSEQEEGSDDGEDDEGEDSDKASGSEDSDEEETAPAPVHESLTGAAKADEVEKSNRTVFLGNVSTEAIKSKTAKKTLLRHLVSFCSTLPESTGPHKIESIRFRSVAFASGGGIPKRASFAKREILDETTPSTNAYAVYTTLHAARNAPAALNGTMVLDRHLRVDSLAHPAEIDHKRCVFVGNLSFIDSETPEEDEKTGKKKKARAPADIEEGLWRIFNAHTGGKDKKAVKKNVEFVRVIRDSTTRVGKGFAYVQFYDGNGVEESLPLNGKNFPPMLPRKLRVTRARKIAKKREPSGPEASKSRVDEAQKTMQGRANRLLGRAGAAKVKASANSTIAGNSFVFEGHRATEGSSSIKMKQKSRGSKAKRESRSSKRAAAYKAAGGRRG